MMPARNTRMIDASAATAYTTIVIDGGMRIPNVPAVASDPSAICSSYPRRLNSGKATLAIVAHVAADEPDTDPKMPQPRMLTCIKRPGIRCSQGASPSNICSDKRVRNRISPIQINSGSAASSHEALVPQNAVNRLRPGDVSVKPASPIQPTRPSDMPIHTPAQSTTPSSPSKTAPTTTALIAYRSRLSKILREVAAGMPLVDGDLICGPLAPQHRDQFINDRNEQDD